MSSLRAAFIAASPRLTPRPPRLAGMLIHGSITALWIGLFARAFMSHGVFAWSTGIAYVLYDTLLLFFVAWQSLPLARRTPALPRPTTRPTLGVIVAAHNEAKVLPVTLAALAAQTDRPDLVLIADDGSSDSTPEVLAERYGLATPPPGEIGAASPRDPTLRWLRLPHGGKAVALNQALELVDTEIVLTVDADTLLEPGAIAAIRDAFAAEAGLVAVTGVLTPICDRTLKGRLLQWFQTYEYIRNFISRFAWMQQDGLLLISGAFAGFRRKAVVEVGGFDPDCFVEDYELIHRLHRHSADNGLGWHVRVLGTARATTDAPTTFTAFLRQRRRWFAGFLQTQYWNRDMVGNARYGRLGTRMLPVKAIDTLQPIYGLTAFGLLLAWVLRGDFSLAGPALVVIFGKIAIDLAFHLWSVQLYRNWTGDHTSARLGPALLAALAEPFTFQLLRHTGATLGWVSFLTGRNRWGTQSRSGLAGRAEVSDCPAES